MAEESKKLRIIPAIDEQPPRDIRVEENDRHGYRIRQDEKATQGILGIIGRNMGRLVAQATQPDNIKLPYFRGPDAATPPTTMATMNVRFDPEEESSPLPALATLQGKLRVGTGYSVLFMDEIPTSPANFHNNIYRGIFRETLSMPTRSLSNTEWKKHTSSASPGTGDAEIPNPSKKYKGGSFYTAQIKVPVLLTRDNKVFVPSFDSCLISRIYTLDLYVSLKTPGWALTNPKLHLKLPLHVFSERSPNAQEIISAEVCLDPCYERPIPVFCGRSSFTDTRYSPTQEEAATAIREGNPHPDPNRVVPRVPEYSEHALPDAPSTLSEAPIISRRPQRSRAQQARGASLTFEDEEAPPPNYNDLPTAGGSNGQLRGANRQPSIGTLARQPSSIIDFADH